MKAIEVFAQNNGEVTKAYYDKLNGLGAMGEMAVALFRAQKRSTAAKAYRGRRFRGAAYDVKNWSLTEVSRILTQNPGLSIQWGWKEDSGCVGFEWVLYVELPGVGQCSFHSATRGDGPDYTAEWDGKRESTERILIFCDRVELAVVLSEDMRARGYR